jgi:predicted TIM-barrel fold metal-dependent hydrolase
MLAAEAARTRDKVKEVGKGSRLLIHGIVQPNEAPWERTDEYMRELVEAWKIDAWKLYTVWGPNREGYWLDSELGKKTIAHGLALGRSLFAVHKGLPLPGMNASFTSPRDVGPVAKAFPEATFLIYHSGWEAEHREGPYDPRAERGVDVLIHSLESSGLGKDANVYAELGSTWRELMKKPDQAAHVLGKLLKHLGEDRILWGTDAIWYGSPQDQIQAFRAFEISEKLQEAHGYPALTPERKAKIFGLNAARIYGIDIDRRKAELARDTLSSVRAERAPNPSFQTLGPKTRREMLSLLRATAGRPD